MDDWYNIYQANQAARANRARYYDEAATAVATVNEARDKALAAVEIVAPHALPRVAAVHTYGDAARYRRRVDRVGARYDAEPTERRRMAFNRTLLISRAAFAIHYAAFAAECFEKEAWELVARSTKTAHRLANAAEEALPV